MFFWLFIEICVSPSVNVLIVAVIAAIRRVGEPTLNSFTGRGRAPVCLFVGLFVCLFVSLFSSNPFSSPSESRCELPLLRHSPAFGACLGDVWIVGAGCYPAAALALSLLFIICDPPSLSLSLYLCCRYIRFRSGSAVLPSLVFGGNSLKMAIGHFPSEDAPASF